MSGETLYEALERLKKYLRQCPQHGLSKHKIVQTFYKGIDKPTRNTIDKSARGTIMHKTPHEAYKLIEDITVHMHDSYASQDGVSRKVVVKVVEADGVSDIAALTNQMAMFNKKFDKLNATVVAMLVGCESCGGPHLTKDYDDKPVSSSEDACWLLSQRQPGSLQSNKETNLNAHVNAITTRSGKKTTDPPFPFNENVVKPVKKEENDKQLHINLPFVEALSQIPKYAKFLEDILTNKKKLEDLSTVIMSEECSAILEGKLPKRMSDPFKDLLPHLEYAFLKSESKLPIIISSDLTRNEKEKLIKVLKANKEAIAYDIKGEEDVNREMITSQLWEKLWLYDEIGILQDGGELLKIRSKISKDEDLLMKIKITEDIYLFISLC
ncbi:hypothetical protein Tco_0873332 [Tanacetum coccineum]